MRKCDIVIDHTTQGRHTAYKLTIPLGVVSVCIYIYGLCSASYCSSSNVCLYVIYRVREVATRKQRKPYQEWKMGGGGVKSNTFSNQTSCLSQPQPRTTTKLSETPPHQQKHTHQTTHIQYISYEARTIVPSSGTTKRTHVSHECAMCTYLYAGWCVKTPYAIRYFIYITRVRCYVILHLELWCLWVACFVSVPDVCALTHQFYKSDVIRCGYCKAQCMYVYILHVHSEQMHVGRCLAAPGWTQSCPIQFHIRPIDFAL